MLHRTLPAIAGLMLAACQSVPVTSVPALARLDPLALNGDGLGAEITHDAALRLDEGDATLRLTLSRRDGPMLLNEHFPLAITEREKGRDRVVTAFQIEPAHHPRFDSAMASIRERREAGKKRYSVAMSVDLKPCQDAGAGRNVDRVDIDLTAPASNATLPLSRGLSLSAQGVPVPECVPPA